jgi:hypothetical protein
MRSKLIATVAALVASLSVGACGSRDATGPTISLSLEEVYALANELGGVMNSMSLSLRASGSSAFSILPGPGFSAAGPITSTARCPGGGTASATGSYSGTTTVTADVTLTYSGCKTAHYVTSGSVRASASATSTETTASGQATVGGTLRVTASDGRSGTCEVDFTATGSASASQANRPAFTISGAACGANVSGTY